MPRRCPCKEQRPLMMMYSRGRRSTHPDCELANLVSSRSQTHFCLCWETSCNCHDRDRDRCRDRHTWCFHTLDSSFPLYLWWIQFPGRQQRDPFRGLAGYELHTFPNSPPPPWAQKLVPPVSLTFGFLVYESFLFNQQCQLVSQSLQAPLVFPHGP